MMTDYYRRSMRALQLAGMSERTQQCYTRAVRQLVDFYDKTPDQITETELEDYFLHRRNVTKWSAATMRICYSGIKLFFVNVLKHDWHIFTYLNAKRERRLPCILTKEEVFHILDHVTTFHNYTFFSTRNNRVKSSFLTHVVSFLCYQSFFSASYLSLSFVLHACLPGIRRIVSDNICQE